MLKLHQFLLPEFQIRLVSTLISATILDRILFVDKRIAEQF